MPGENFTVNYNIKVTDSGSAAIASFVTATESLTTATSAFTQLNETIGALNANFKTLRASKGTTIKINTSEANRKLNTLLDKLRKIETKLQTLGLPVTALGGALGSTQPLGGSKDPASGPQKKAQSVPKKTSNRPVVRTAPRSRANIGYQALGQTLIDTGGVGALDFLKGMGIAYGIAGIGSMVGNVVKSSVDYDNMIQTTKNILFSHDNGTDKYQRFSDMEKIIRNVGVQTKFTAPEVADASKFLAMAGFNIEAINQAIRPIADIALIGDDDLGKTADVVTNIMTGYGIAPSEVRRAADIMTQTFTMSNTTLMEMAEAYKYAGSLLARNKTPFEEATAAIGILGDAGIKGSQAGTTLRTMAINLAKPTAKQAAMWEEIGVKRLDENGNVRSMIDIFNDLATKNLNLGQFSQLFHKTAASGASALAANVEKWNEIIAANFLSEGMSKRLADAKKNTLQGLWAQLTSAFTEIGMQTFQDMQGDISGILGQAIDWLKSPEALDAVKRFGAFLTSIAHSLAKVTTRLYDLYQHFQGWISLWLRLQLRLSMVLIPLRAISALFKFGSFAVNGVRQINGLTLQFKALAIQARSAWQAMRGVNVAAAGVAVTGGKGPKRIPPAWLSTGRINSFTAWRRIMQRREGSRGFIRASLGYGMQRTATYMNGASGLGMMLGGGLGAYLGSNLGQEGSFLSGLGSLAGGMGGMALGSLGARTAGKLLVRGSNALAAAGGLGGVLGTLGGTFALGGLAASAIIAPFVILATHVHKATKAVEEYRSTLEALNGVNLSDHATRTDQYLKIVYDDQLNVNKQVGEYIRLRKEELELMTENDAITKFKGSGAIWDRYTMYRRSHLWSDYAAMPEFLRDLGRDLTEGSYTQKYRDQFLNSLFQTTTLAGFEQEQKAARDNIDNMKINGVSHDWSSIKVGDLTLEDLYKDFSFVSTFANVMQPFVSAPGTYGVTTNKAVEAFYNLVQDMEQNGKVSDDLVYKFFRERGMFFMDTDKWGLPGSDKFMSILGFQPNGNFEPTTFIDNEGKQYPISTSTQAMELLSAFRQQVVDMLTMMGPEWTKILQHMLEPSVWRPKTNNGKPWSESTWNPISGDQMTDEEFMETLDGGTNATSADYSHQYKSTSAAPKQIIMNIGSLMDVRNIDLTNPNNQAVIASIKAQLGQALAEVVSDFSVTLG